MNQALNELIPKAIDAIQTKIALDNGNVVKEYRGYLNGMGPGLIQAGLVTMLAFCTDIEKKRIEVHRNNVLKAILYMIDQDYSAKEDNHLLKYVISKCLKEGSHYNQNQRLTSTDLDPEKVEAMEVKIMDHVLALKMAIKTFHLIEKPKEDRS